MSQRKQAAYITLFGFLSAAITFAGIALFGWPAWLLFAIPVFAGPPLTLLFHYLADGGGERIMRSLRDGH